MNTVSRRHFAAASVLGLALPLLPRVAKAQESAGYSFSPQNQHSVEMTARYWNPIIDHVAASSGVKLQLKIGRTSADTTAFVIANEVEFAFTNQLFSPERERMGWKIFGRRRTPPIYSQIIVLANSPIRKLEELSGQAVAFSGREALVAYRFAYAQLLRRSIAVSVVFSGNMDGAFAQLASGKVRAVGSNSQLTDGWVQRRGTRVHVLWQSEPLYDLPLMASRKVPKRDLLAVSRAFLEMAKDPKGQSLLAHAAELVKLPAGTDFVASDGSEYGAYRRFYQTAPSSLR